MTEGDVYEAAVTVMMRLVFLLFAEDQRPPLFGNEPLYDAHYAISSLIDQLQAQADRAGEEVLERKEDAWSRLLSTFRLVHGGSDHDQMRLPAYGGSLFDPDRFAFLEGRARGTDWERDEAKPLPINNRTVLHILEAIQFLEMRGGRFGAERRRLSFRALDVEQIGHVYERLLEHTVRRADGPVLGLTGSTRGGARQEPEIPLADLDTWLERGDRFLLAELTEMTGRTISQLKAALTQPLELGADTRFLVACDNDSELWARVRPFANLIRVDRSGRPWIVRDGGLYVTSGTGRRQSGAHYTPRSLTEPIAQHTLEPLVYDGPAEGAPKEDWRLRPASALLALKICDPAMGSGAFLVQTCRYLSERLVEAWGAAEAVSESAGQLQIRIAPDGSISHGESGEHLLPADPAERIALARQLVTDHCLYGVDINPLAVEMAKLSLWLVTLHRDRPFTFLDHRLRIGDSLLGIGDIKQLEHWSLSGNAERQNAWITPPIHRALQDAIRWRTKIEQTPVLNAKDAETKACDLAEAEDVLATVRLGADLLIGAALAENRQGRESLRLHYQNEFALTLNHSNERRKGVCHAGRNGAVPTQQVKLAGEARSLLGSNRPFHWPLEFPEIFVTPNANVDGAGFSSIVTNPPFQGGQMITGALGTPYRDYLVEQVASGSRGSADLAAYFLLRIRRLIKHGGCFGTLTTKTIAQGITRTVGLDQVLRDGCILIRAVRSRKWPGQANLEVSHLWLRRGDWQGQTVLDDRLVPGITPSLAPADFALGQPHTLLANAQKSFQGSIVLGMGFTLAPQQAWKLIEKNESNAEVLFPYLNGEDLNSRFDQSASRWIINFKNFSLEQAESYPECMEIVRKKVKPERLEQNDKGAREYWWRYLRPRPELYGAIAEMDRVLVSARVSAYHFFEFSPTNLVFSDRLVVIALDSFPYFALLSSTVHDSWAHRPGATTHETRSTYFPTFAFETFPMCHHSPHLNDIGERYYLKRQGIMLDHQQGLRATYSQFHHTNTFDDDIASLRRLHVEMDYAVTDAYGWDDLDLGHGFQETKEGTRFTISEEARHAVLERLLELNHERYAEEVAAGLHDKGTRKRAASRGPQAHRQLLITQ